jgi:hypothetical protein
MKTKVKKTHGKDLDAGLGMADVFGGGDAFDHFPADSLFVAQIHTKFRLDA